tara:strand:+ start:254 stop:415 length:162 start_codon:yes stop_codon:yes gene_type:complete
MNPIKQHKKLARLALKAGKCLSREEARECIRKAEKAHRKLEKFDAAVQKSTDQ